MEHHHQECPPTSIKTLCVLESIPLSAQMHHPVWLMYTGGCGVIWLYYTRNVWKLGLHTWSLLRNGCEIPWWGKRPRTRMAPAVVLRATLWRSSGTRFGGNLGHEILSRFSRIYYDISSIVTRSSWRPRRYMMIFEVLSKFMYESATCQTSWGMRICIDKLKRKF
jgi:hypothetical protein